MELTFIRNENIEQENRGWIVDKLSAVNEAGEEVGYLKIEMIPGEEFRRWYPTAVDLMIHIHGWAVGHWGPDVIGNITLDKFKALAWYFWKKEFPHLQEGTKEFDHLVKKLVRGVNRTYAAKLNQFKEYHVDAPKPAWVWVQPEYRRQGIGTKLYMEAARWMAERGLRLRASTLRSKDAEGIWNSFFAKGMVEKRDEFLYLIS